MLTGLISLVERERDRETVSNSLWFAQLRSIRLQSSSRRGGF